MPALDSQPDSDLICAQMETEQKESLRIKLDERKRQLTSVRSKLRASEKQLGVEPAAEG